MVRFCEQLHFAVDGAVATLITSAPVQFFQAYGIPDKFKVSRVGTVDNFIPATPVLPITYLSTICWRIIHICG